MLKVLPAPNIVDASLVSSATYAPGPVPVAPSSIASIFGSYLDDGSLIYSTSFGPDGRLITSLGGAKVKINGISTPMFAAVPGQLAVQIPAELAGQVSATIQVEVLGQPSFQRTILLADVVPGVYTLSQDGTGPAVVVHANGALVNSQNPAHPGEIVLLFATGLGAVNPPLATGAPSVGNQTVALTKVTVDGNSGEVLFSGAAPNFAGLYQINFRIPANARTAPDLLLVLTVGGRNANPVTIAVGP